MPCTAPIEQTINGYTFQHACGRCLACRIRMRDEWAIRIILESQQYATSLFVTLTYDQENYPEDGSLSKRELQLFNKRLRKNIDQKYRYFACGEYGSKTGRAHYHAILFGLSEEYEKWIEKSWSKGFVNVKIFNPGRHAKYVAKYITKAIGSQKFLQDGRQKEFALMSRKPGIGHVAYKWLRAKVERGIIRIECSPSAGEMENQTVPTMKGSLRYNGRLYPMPSYIKKKLVEMEGALPKDDYYRSLEEKTDRIVEGGSDFDEILRRADARLKALDRGRKYLRRISEEETL